ncbi:MAG: hypothetical protein AB1297_03170 [bacterium]
MIEPTFDKEGYPTEETLETIKNWKIEDFQKDIEELLLYICHAWHWEKFASNVRPGIWTFATGGWFGNKALLNALYQSSEAWLFILVYGNTIELEGGFLCIATTKEAKKEMKKLQDKIVRWGWKEAKEKNRKNKCQ